MRKNCVFCNIVDGETPSKKVYEDEDVLAFLDINPVTQGHTLVIPKEHYHDIFEIPPQALNKVIQIAKKVSKGLKESLDAEGINLLHNSGSIAQQAVPHFHIHVIPRYEADSINIFPKRKAKSEGLDEIARKINI